MSRSAKIGLGAVLLVLGFGLTSGDVQRSMHGDPYEVHRETGSAYTGSFWGSWGMKGGSSTRRFDPGLAEAAGWITAALGAGLLAVGLGSARRTDESSS